MNKVYFPFLLILLLSSCLGESTQTNAVQSSNFFDLKAYFAEELKDLTQLQGKISKTTQINGQSESHTFDSLNFAEELSVFIDSDINRPAWSDQYSVDSTMSQTGDLLTLEYEALREDLKTRRLRVEFSGKKAQVIQIEKLAQNALMNAAMQLEYRSGERYRIQSNQQLKMSDEQEMVVEVSLPES